MQRIHNKHSRLRLYASSFGGDFKPNLEPLTKGLVKSGMNIQEYLEQETEKLVEIVPFEPSESWWNWLKKSLTATQCWIGAHIWQTKEIIGVFEDVGKLL